MAHKIIQKKKKIISKKSVKMKFNLVVKNTPFSSSLQKQFQLP